MIKEEKVVRRVD